MRASLNFFSAICFALCVACGAVAQDTATVGKFKFNDWEGPALTVYMVEPANAQPNAPVVIVMHGIRRNAKEYRDNWIDLAETYGLRVYVPRFDPRRFPKAAKYNLGGVDRRGVNAFEAIEPLFAHIQSERDSTAEAYTIFGHSAGAQFVHRFTCFTDTPHLKLAIAANAGWYTMPSQTQDWPYGLQGVEEEACTPEEWFLKPLLVMLGDKDTNPRDSNLRRTPEAMAQGAHRVARGINFLNMAKTTADEAGLSIAWRFNIVEGVAHDNRGMAVAAASMIASNTENTAAPIEEQQ